MMHYEKRKHRIERVFFFGGGVMRNGVPGRVVNGPMFVKDNEVLNGTFCKIRFQETNENFLD